MRWLVHGNLTSAATDALVRHGHSAAALDQLALAPGAGAIEILKAAQQKQLDILTADSALAGAPFAEHYPFNRCIVFLQLQGGDVEQDDAIDRLFDRYKRLAPRRLYTVTATRVKVRQLPTTGRRPDITEKE